MITGNVRKLLEEIPEGIEVLAAAKTRTVAEISEAVAAGIKIIGENYVQEALRVHEQVVERARWHFIGHLQTNKVKKVVGIFDMIQTVDSLRLAREIDKRSYAIGKVMPVLIEINSGREPQKAGILSEDAVSVIKEIALLPNLAIKGLMTMGPLAGNPEDARPYFVETRLLFEKLKEMELPEVEMIILSMGMTNSYRVAIEEGSTMVRIGTMIFGPRSCDVRT
ncbi:MAG: YggS family pyridoxal phosphate-dependent enzyme [Candidatus Euphemobacter frigidus]|nr:YggS family pyridoxal phosphate-dependent enzyme [Candidatus Euphemobacter frigidus]MDP8276519.1 YggS family pyridoxal phosphate-dependent enzyme [Candidatus Euphemobacter frigidus]